MVISADFEKQKQYFVKKKLLLSKKLSLYRNIACKNCSSDEGLRMHFSDIFFTDDDKSTFDIFSMLVSIFANSTM
jgi:hypothetical protein